MALKLEKHFLIASVNASSICFTTPSNDSKTLEKSCDDIANYDNYANVIYNEKNKKKVCGYHIQGTVLQLVACGLVEMHVEKETEIFIF